MAWSSAVIADQKEPETKLLIDNIFHLTEVMVTDVASPPAAARFYAYGLMGAHLAWLHANELPLDNSLLSHSNVSIENLEANGSWNAEFLSTYSMLEVGKHLMPSGKLLLDKQKDLENTFLLKKWLTKKALEANRNEAVKIANKVLDLASQDGYKQLSALTRYSPKKGDGHWYPTPPAYMAAVEPEWRTIKTFLIEDVPSYKPNPPAPYDLTEGSSFRKQLEEVYQVTKALDDEQKLIANFWDCNPFKVSYSGHMAIGIKKISPGGHWIGITGIASQQAKLSWEETIEIHSLLAMGLHDGFISCWEEKYDSDRIRPESAINRHLDNNWRPLLQTPPFPEYTSGHSVISQVSAVILTDYFGDDFRFIDTSEVYFGLPEREFSSFQQAAQEAAISRLYGGIHFRDAIEEGIKQGDRIGRAIVAMRKLKAEG